MIAEILNNRLSKLLVYMGHQKTTKNFYCNFSAKSFLWILVIFCGINFAHAQNPAFQVSSTSGGFVAPIMTNAQRTAIATPATGSLVYQSDGTAGYYYYNGTAWVQILAGTSGAVTSISGGTTGLTPNTATTGAVTLAGTLNVANGGTGTSTAFTQGSVVFAGASGIYSQDNGNFFWDNTNKRLGIGVGTTPSQALHVVDAAAFDIAQFQGRNGFGAAMVLNATGGGGRSWNLISTANSAGEGAGKFLIKDLAGGGVRMTIEGITGNVGIGTTAPATTLDVNGVANAATGFRIANAATSGNYLRGNGTNFVSSAIQAADLPDLSGTYIRNQTLQQASSNFNISGNGTVGGTFTTGSSANAAGTYTNQNNINGSGQILIGSGLNGDPSIKATKAGAWTRIGAAAGLSFWADGNSDVNSTPQFHIASSGNVGIGNSTPTEKLDVTGNVKFSGALMPAALPGTSGQYLRSSGAAVAPVWQTPVSKVTVPISFFGTATGTAVTATTFGCGTYYTTGATSTTPGSLTVANLGGTAYSIGQYVTSNGTFSGANGVVLSRAATTITVRVYKYTPVNNSSVAVTGTLINSFTTATTVSGNLYTWSVSPSGTASNNTLTKGDFIVVWYSASASNAINAQGSWEMTTSIQ